MAGRFSQNHAGFTITAEAIIGETCADAARPSCLGRSAQYTAIAA
jgi:hypothetical protein